LFPASASEADAAMVKMATAIAVIVLVAFIVLTLSRLGLDCFWPSLAALNIESVGTRDLLQEKN
jgi:hypothetical protein